MDEHSLGQSGASAEEAEDSIWKREKKGKRKGEKKGKKKHMGNGEGKKGRWLATVDVTGRDPVECVDDPVKLHRGRYCWSVLTETAGGVRAAKSPSHLTSSPQHVTDHMLAESGNRHAGTVHDLSLYETHAPQSTTSTTTTSTTSTSTTELLFSLLRLLLFSSVPLTLAVITAGPSPCRWICRLCLRKTLIWVFKCGNGVLVTHFVLATLMSALASSIGHSSK
ncbi:hypothetical protein EYF80_024080 [Liparis tanakae]|uniref:Uncharacterized protein n=1 Tax=Liparis tanakae TaxID=230148 RepID=A0A4Z2HIP2_9TELE|nr:hypothetical protein EYF80_024080 [Liparis tanakae]